MEDADVIGVVEGGSEAVVWLKQERNQGEEIQPQRVVAVVETLDGTTICASCRPFQLIKLRRKVRIDWLSTPASSDFSSNACSRLEVLVSSAVWNGITRKTESRARLPIRIETINIKDRLKECSEIQIESILNKSARETIVQDKIELSMLDIRFGALVRHQSLLAVSPFADQYAHVMLDSSDQCERVMAVGRKTRISFIPCQSKQVRCAELNRFMGGVPSHEEWTSAVCRELGDYMRLPAEKLTLWLHRAFARMAKEDSVEPFGRGCVIYGDSGVGKRMLLEHVLGLAGVSWTKVSADQIFRPEKGQGEAFLEETLVKRGAKNSVPFVVLLDRIDTMSGGAGDSERIYSTLLNCIDRALTNEDTRNLLIIGLTSAMEFVDAELINPKRLGTQVHVEGLVGLEQRGNLLDKLVARNRVSLGEEERADLVRRANGLLPAELDAVVRMLKLRVGDEPVGKRDISAAFLATQVSSLKEEKIKTIREDNEAATVVGQEDIKAKLQTAVLLPLLHPEKLGLLGVECGPRGVLLYGPSGNGKTMLARYIAKEADRRGLANAISVQCRDLISKVVGQSEAAISTVFRQARAAAPCILVLDQIEAIAPRRGFDSTSQQTMDRLLSCLLMELDGIQSKFSRNKQAVASVVVIACTDKKDRLDPALLRPGRFDYHIHVSPPHSSEERRLLLAEAFKKTPFEDESIRDDMLRTLAESNVTASMSRAELCSRAREAIMLALRQDIHRETLAPNFIHETFTDKTTS